MLRLIPPYPPAEARNTPGMADSVGTVGYVCLGSIRYEEEEEEEEVVVVVVVVVVGLWLAAVVEVLPPLPLGSSAVAVAVAVVVTAARGLIGTHGSAWRAYHANSMYPNFSRAADAPDSAKCLFWKKAVICVRVAGSGGGGGRGEGGIDWFDWLVG